MSNIESLAWILGCKIGSLPSSYLGLPLGAKFKSKEVWNPVIERITLRLDSWKAKLLLNGSRSTLLKIVLASIPNYFLPLFTIPGLVAIRIETLFWKFIWNDLEEHHRYHLVDWNFICKPLCEGGLGLRSIRDHNRDLLAKWLWRFGKKERDSLWHWVVVAKFGLDSVWDSRRVQLRHGCGIWKLIQSLIWVFWNHARFKMGSGNNIRFWPDRLIRDIHFKDSFRSLFNLAINPKESVVGSFDVGGNIWMPRLCKDLNYWEFDELY